MDTWTRQMGFPLVSISREGSSIYANQTRFLLTPDPLDETVQRDQPKSQFGYKWYVPLSYYTDTSDEEETVWMNMTDSKWTKEENVLLWHIRVSIHCSRSAITQCPTPYVHFVIACIYSCIHSPFRLSGQTLNC